MVNKIKTIFTDDFIRQISKDKIIIDLKEKNETCNITFEKGKFIEISDIFFESLGNKLFPGKLSNHSDGIILNKLGDKYNLFLIEYKKIIWKNFNKMCNQLDSTYIKVSMILNLIFNIDEIKVTYILVGKIHDRAQNKVLSSKTNKPDYFNIIVRKQYANIKEIPFKVDIPINNIFKKSNVSLILKECNSFVDISS